MLKEYLGIPMRVMVKEDMAAHKLMAMRNRVGKANRDIFDVWYFLSNNWAVNKHLIEQIEGISYKEFLEQAIESLSMLSDQHILDGLVDTLTHK